MRDNVNLPSFSTQLTPQALRQLRLQKRESQETFWGRFGVTQSTGSRFEIASPLRPTLALMIRLYVDGKLTDELLDDYVNLPTPLP